MLKGKKNSQLEIENGFGLGLAFIAWEQAPFKAAVSFRSQGAKSNLILLSSIHSCLFRKLLSVHTRHWYSTQAAEPEEWKPILGRIKSAQPAGTSLEVVCISTIFLPPKISFFFHCINEILNVCLHPNTFYGLFYFRLCPHAHVFLYSW